MDCGKVLWFDVKKGFGFIRKDDGSDVFVHYSKILADPGEFRLLTENQSVQFETFFADRGKDQGQKPQAKNVRILKGDGDEVLQEAGDNSFRGSSNRAETG